MRQQELVFFDTSKFNPYQRFLHLVYEKVNASGTVARDADYNEVAILSAKAKYFPLQIAAERVLADCKLQSGYEKRLYATLDALHPNWWELNCEDSKNLVRRIIEEFAMPKETGPSRFAPQFQALQHLLQQGVKPAKAIQTLGAMRKPIRTLFMGIAGGRLPNTPELGLMTLEKAEYVLEDNLLELFALYGTWSMVRNRYYQAR